jgi:hypothetical protein
MNFWITGPADLLDSGFPKMVMAGILHPGILTTKP